MLIDVRNKIATAVTQAVNELPGFSGIVPGVTLEIPQDRQHGDLACNMAMRLAGLLKKNPLELGEQLKVLLEKKLVVGYPDSPVVKIELKRPGFLNFFFSNAVWQQVVAAIHRDGRDFGRSNFGQNKKVQIEFVSANPTGPLSVAHARQAAVGDALANILKFTGHAVTKEFYVNDEGNQINILGRSVRDRARQILGESFDFPEDNYQGDYIKDMARDFMGIRHITSVEQIKSMDPTVASQYAGNFLLSIIKKELSDFGVQFDVWSHQSVVATAAKTQEMVDFLRQRGFVYDQDGAAWLQSTKFGDDKDRVVKKSDGSFTYLAPDIVYHQNKFQRGFDLVINMWGPDHHGYIPRLKAAVAALGYNPDQLVVLIVQLATIFRDGQELSMSTRRGQYISLQEVMDEVGVDAGRFFFLMRHIKAHLEFDLELAKKQTPENPVYYVQYAHARISSILDTAREQSLTPATADFALLNQEEELALIKTLGQFPEMLINCSVQLEPYGLVDYLQGLATAFHRFYDKHRILSEETLLTQQRLGLSQATKVVLGVGLNILGVSAPDKM